MEHERSRLTVWSFLKGLFKVVIGFSLLVQSLLFLLLLVFILGIVSSISTSLSGDGSEGPSIAVPDGGALVLNPQGTLVEIAPPVDPFDEAIARALGGGSSPQVSVHELVRAVRAAAGDDRITTLVLDLQGLYIPSSYASKAHYLASEVEAFRETGKRVIAIGDYYSQEQYLIASEADTVLLHDQGGMMIEGYGVYRQYFQSALERLQVTANVFRVGTFKSALEPYLGDEMSEAAALANRAYLDVLWDEYTTAIDANRDLSSGATRAYANNIVDVVQNAGGSFAQAAFNAGFIDRLMSRGEQVDFVADVVGRDAVDPAGFRGIPYRSYLYSVPGFVDRERVPNVAVITAAGTIVGGDEPYGVAAGDYIARQLRNARTDDTVRAVVLRVDSPGGSAFAAEIIRDELLRLKAVGKPVIVSMGSLAASGGYWISADADEIWAAPTTLTGSIGVFGFIPTFENTAAEVGVYTDGVGTTPLSAIMGAGLGPLPEAFSAIVQASIEDTYSSFLNIVAEGRGITTVAADEIGQGRVWIGRTAENINLVDQLGNLDDAIASAAARANLSDYDVVGMTQPKSRFDLFLEGLANSEQARLEGLTEISISDIMFGEKRSRALTLARVLEFVQAEAAFLGSFDDPNGVYVRCLECVTQ